MAAGIFSIFQAIAAIPAILASCEKFGAMVAAWYIAKQNARVLSSMVDAMALQARAESDEDRYQASDALRVAMSLPRVRP